MAAEAGGGGRTERSRSSSTTTYTASELASYECLGTIGKGSFGTVSRIRRIADGRLMVWKELNYGHMREKEKMLAVSEVNILRELQHPFIVRYYDRIIDKEKMRLYIVMEHCEGGDLGRLIKRCKRSREYLDEDFIWRCASQVVCALKKCHRHKEEGRLKPILHRDLKPGNIFLDGSRNVKIGDFGLAKELSSKSKYAYTNVGTPFYMSPEMINESRHNEKSDIWALGCLLYEMAALAPPFEATNQLSLAVKINEGKFARIPERYSDDLHRVIRWCLSLEQDKRPAVEDLERLPRLRPYSREAAAIVREYQLKQTYNARLRELQAREEKVRRREQEVARREKALEARLTRASVTDSSATAICSTAVSSSAASAAVHADSSSGL